MPIFLKEMPTNFDWKQIEEILEEISVIQKWWSKKRDFCVQVFTTQGSF